MKIRERNLYICFIFVLCIAACAVGSACGKPYELIISDSEANAGSEADANSEINANNETNVNSETNANTETDADSVSAAAAAENENAAPAPICVYVCGAVQNAGVYTLAPGSRLYEAIAAAGGLTEEAEPRALNQAQLLEDGQQITVYTREEADAAGIGSVNRITGQSGDGNTKNSSGAVKGESGGAEIGAGIVNLNTAGREELMTLNGIGAARAEAIIEYREQNGAFTSVEEIMQIDGIGEKSFEKLRDRITV